MTNEVADDLIKKLSKIAVAMGMAGMTKEGSDVLDAACLIGELAEQAPARLLPPYHPIAAERKRLADIVQAEINRCDQRSITSGNQSVSGTVAWCMCSDTARVILNELQNG